ncbi:MAG: GGDEF domain-containing response regulator [Xanthobacteraceae bacterium]
MRIVLVDPSRAVHRVMTRLIEEGGHDVVAFADGRDALAYVAQDDRVRALITSTEPGSISGIELCAAVRKLSGTRRALHVVLMSSTDDYYLAVAALDNGADDFIHKPPNPDELRARLRLADRVTAMKRQLIQFATRDSLTGLLNRRAFFEDATAACQALKPNEALSVIIFDIDHFKRVNDTYGHDTGDRVLAEVGARVKLSDGIAGRLGGEEFCILARGAAADAVECASDLQRSIRALHFDHDGHAFGVTCSFGIAEWEPGDVADRMLRRADVAMYEAKKAGRDRIVVADDFEHTRSHEEWRGTARADKARVKRSQ